MTRVLTIPVIAACLLLPGVAAAQQSSNTNQPSEAMQLLKDACQFLAEAPAFSITAEIWRDHVDENGQKIQFSRELTMDVKRPNGLHVEMTSGHTQRGFWFDGKTFSALDRKQNLYSTIGLEGNVDSALDRARDEFGVDIPLVDLALSDPYANATAKVQSSRAFGTAPAMGYTCRHLAFSQDNVDWQIWIDAGPQPLIRKFVITYKNEPGSPEFTGLIRSWNFADRIPDSRFVFRPPQGAAKVQMRKDLAMSANNTPNESVESNRK